VKVSSRAVRGIAGLASLAALAMGSSAGANHTLFGQVSSGGNGVGFPKFAGASQDGTRAFFVTDEGIDPADTDGRSDVYEHSGGVTTLVSTGPSTGGSFFPDTEFKGTSTDGARVLFTTAKRLVPGDTDNQQDVYMRSAGTTALLSTGPAGGNGNFTAFYGGASEDATRIFFTTGERLVAADMDSEQDVYESSGGTTTLVSTVSSGGNGAFGASYAGVSKDGTRVFFSTAESLLGADTDTNQDLYERAGGTTTLVSTGPAGGNGTFDVAFAGSSADGTHVFFSTSERLVAADTDVTADLYERFGGTTSLLSIGSLGGNGNINAFYAGASEDGSRVFITTSEALESADFDGSIDIYERSGGTTTLISPPPVSGGQGNVTFGRVTPDGAHVFFETVERLTADDDNAVRDVYENFAGTTTRVSKGPLSAASPSGALFDGASDDGSRVFFTTDDSLVARDTGGSSGFPDSDVYERFGGQTYLVSAGVNIGADSAVFDHNTPEGTHVFFHTASMLASTDTDGGYPDIYDAVVNYTRPKGATPLSVALVPAFAACASPNRTHGSPLAYGSCAPPVQVSPNVTVGTPDANGAAANSTGSVVFSVGSGDVKINARLSDVRCQGSVSTCGSANAAGGADYTGELQGSTTARLTDRLNGEVPTDPGTMTDTPLSFVLSCTSTAATDQGGSCSVSTSVNALTPGTVKAGTRAVWELGQVRVLDGGTDGAVATTPNALFAVEGVFVP
jgi:hypothetical protein